MAEQYLNDNGLRTLIEQIKAQTGKTYKVKGEAIYADTDYLANPNKPSAVTSEGLWQLINGSWTKITTFEVGWVYNIKNTFTTNEDFIEGAGSTVAPGTNIVVAEAGGSPVVYKWDQLGAFVDTTNLQAKNLTTPLSIFNASEGTAVEYAASSSLPASEAKASATIENDTVAIITGASEAGDCYKATVVEDPNDATRNNITWEKIGNQTTVEGALELISNVVPVKPISDSEIIAMFNS